MPTTPCRLAEPTYTGSPDVSSAMTGDRAALRAVWQTHRRWVAAVLLAHKPAGADLEDLLQDVAVALVTHIRQLDDPAAFRPWLRQIAINTARNAGRKSARRQRAIAPGSPGDAALRLTTSRHAPADRHTEPGHAHRLLELARTLPEGYREPLLLRCVRGLTHRQIGELLDLPETTVETRIARGRRMLRELATSHQPPGTRDQKNPMSAHQPTRRGGTSHA